MNFPWKRRRENSRDERRAREIIAVTARLGNLAAKLNAALKRPTQGRIIMSQNQPTQADVDAAIAALTATEITLDAAATAMVTAYNNDQQEIQTILNSGNDLATQISQITAVNTRMAANVTAMNAALPAVSSGTTSTTGTTGATGTTGQ